MRLCRIPYLLCVLGLLSVPAFAQDDPNFETGLKPFGSFHGGNIDTINLLNGNLTIDIPLISYPQRGGKLKLDFVLHYVNLGTYDDNVCTANCVLPVGPAYLHGFYVTERGAPGVLSTGYESPACFTGGNYANPVCTSIPGVSILMPDGSVHGMGPVGSTTPTSWETVDGSAFRSTASSATDNLVTDPSGVLYSGINWTSTSQSSIYPPPATPPLMREDTNGNQISWNSTSGWVDTFGRTIPPYNQESIMYINADGSYVPAQFTGPTTQNYSGCSGSLPIAAAWVWNLPGLNGGSYSIKFCYAQISETLPWTPACLISPCLSSTYQTFELQSVVLPNGTTWAFQYTTDGHADLAQITFPTGGTLSYTWTSPLVGPHSHTFLFTRGIATRTLNPNDGVDPAGTWSYSYTENTSACLSLSTCTTTTQVTDPLGNASVHTFSNLFSNVWSFLETQAKYYQGSSASGTLLKTVNTGYSTFVGPNIGASGSAVPAWSAAFPTQTTTVLPNGQQSQVQHAYDSSLVLRNPTLTSSGTFSSSTTYPEPYGKELTKTEFDYGNGAPGALLRTTTNAYLALSSSTYLTNNLLNLPASVTVTDGGGTQRALTNYAYDATTPASSGITTQMDSSPPFGTARGNLTSTARWLNTSGAYLTNTNTNFDTGEVQTSTDPKGNATTYAYSSTDVGAFPTTVTNALSQSATSAFDFNTGLLTSTTDANGQTTSYTYDNLLRTTQVTAPDGGGAGFCYTDSGGSACSQSGPLFDVVITEKITSTQNKTVTAAVDGLGRLRQAQLNSDPSGTDYNNTVYDALGRRATVSNPYRSTSDPTYGVTTTAYDGLGRPVSVTKPDGSVVQSQYCGSATLVIDEAGHWRRSITDGLGQLIEVDEPSSSSSASGACAGSGGTVNKTTYAYDALGDLISVVQGGSRNRSFVYDSLKRLTGSTNPETGTVTYTYDADGNVATKTDARSLTIAYSYDALNRLTGRTYSNGDPSVTYTYDQAACLGLAACYNIGRRTSMSDAGGSESLAYDQMGRKLTHQRTTSSVTKTTSYTYNLDGTLATLAYPSGRTITYGYNTAAQSVSAADTANSITYATAGIYGPHGALAQVQNGTNLVSTFIFNDRLQPCWMYATTGTALATSTTCTAADSTPGNILDLHYNFNLGSGDNGNVTGVTNNRDTTRTQSFTYDQLNRIAAAQTNATSGANCWGESFTLDQWANLTAIGALSGYTGCTQESLSVSVGTNNRLTSTGISYDASGNVLTDGMNSYAWNAESEIKSAAGVNYTYDGDGDRVQKSNGKIYWYGAGSEILDESDASGNFTNEYVFFGGKRIAMRNVSTGAIYYYTEDMLGSSRTIVQAGQTSPCYDADFYPFGGERTITNTCSQNYKFERKERDTETNNDDFGARYYSSRFGRWLSADWSAVPAPVPYANLSNPQTLNLYAMVNDNPETFADLDGHCAQLGMPVDCGEISKLSGVEGGDDLDKQTLDRMRANSEQAAADKAAADAPAQNTNTQQVGNTTSDALAKTMTNEVGSLSTPKNGDPDVLGDAKDALANTLINNANLDHPGKVAPATGTASPQDAQTMKDAVANRAKGGADPVEGRTQFGTTHNPNLKSRAAGNHLKGEAGRETVYEKFGPFKDSTSRRPTWIVIYNNPGQ